MGNKEPIKRRVYVPEKHCGHKVLRDPEILRQHIKNLEIRLNMTKDGTVQRAACVVQLTAKRDKLARAEKYVAKHGHPDTTPCTLNKGAGTSHVGTGACHWHCMCHGNKEFHLGKNIWKHGLYSKTTNPRLIQILDDLEDAETDLLDLTPDVKVVRALLLNYANENHATMTPDIVKGWSLLIETLRRLVETINEVKLKTAITREVFDIIMERMGQVVMLYVKDPEMLDGIVRDWGKVAIEPKRLIQPKAEKS